MLLPSPKRYSQSFRAKKLTPYAQKTVSSILSKMVQAHYLTLEEKNYSVLAPFSFEKNPPENDSPSEPEEIENEETSQF